MTFAPAAVAASDLVAFVDVVATGYHHECMPVTSYRDLLDTVVADATPSSEDFEISADSNRVVVAVVAEPEALGAVVSWSCIPIRTVIDSDALP